jgi:hypothetical protein
VSKVILIGNRFWDNCIFVFPGALSEVVVIDWHPLQIKPIGRHQPSPPDRADHGKQKNFCQVHHVTPLPDAGP